MNPIAGHNLALYSQLAEAGWDEASISGVHLAYKVGAQISYPLARANWKPFVAHLVGTASIAAWDSSNAVLIHAALVHSALEFGVFPSGIRDVAGKLSFVADRTSREVADLVGRYNDARHTPPLDYTPETAAADPVLLHLRLANSLDDVIDELGLIGTGKHTGELRAGPEGLEKMADLAMIVGAPRLAAAYRELKDWPRQSPVATETRGRSFRVDRLDPSIVTRISVALGRLMGRS